MSRGNPQARNLGRATPATHPDAATALGMHSSRSAGSSRGGGGHAANPLRRRRTLFETIKAGLARLVPNSSDSPASLDVAPSLLLSSRSRERIAGHLLRSEARGGTPTAVNGNGAGAGTGMLHPSALRPVGHPPSPGSLEQAPAPAHPLPTLPRFRLPAVVAQGDLETPGIGLGTFEARRAVLRSCAENSDLSPSTEGSSPDAVAVDGVAHALLPEVRWKNDIRCYPSHSAAASQLLSAARRHRDRLREGTCLPRAVSSLNCLDESANDATINGGEDFAAKAPESIPTSAVVENSEGDWVRGVSVLGRLLGCIGGNAPPTESLLARVLTYLPFSDLARGVLMASWRFYALFLMKSVPIHVSLSLLPRPEREDDVSRGARIVRQLRYIGRFYSLSSLLFREVRPKLRSDVAMAVLELVQLNRRTLSCLHFRVIKPSVVDQPSPSQPRNAPQLQMCRFLDVPGMKVLKLGRSVEGLAALTPALTNLSVIGTHRTPKCLFRARGFPTSLKRVAIQAFNFSPACGPKTATCASSSKASVSHERDPIWSTRALFRGLLDTLPRLESLSYDIEPCVDLAADTLIRIAEKMRRITLRQPSEHFADLGDISRNLFRHLQILTSAKACYVSPLTVFKLEWVPAQTGSSLRTLLRNLPNLPNLQRLELTCMGFMGAIEHALLPKLPSAGSLSASLPHFCHLRIAAGRRLAPGVLRKLQPLFGIHSLRTLSLSTIEESTLEVLKLLRRTLLVASIESLRLVFARRFQLEWSDVLISGILRLLRRCRHSLRVFLVKVVEMEGNKLRSRFAASKEQFESLFHLAATECPFLEDFEFDPLPLFKVRFQKRRWTRLLRSVIFSVDDGEAPAEDGSIVPSEVAGDGSADEDGAEADQKKNEEEEGEVAYEVEEGGIVNDDYDA